ncbi:hypothetical protein D3C73_1237800 [compost metagenome]
MEPRLEERAFDAAFARVLEVRLVIEDVVDAVHGQVVGDQEVESTHDQDPVDFPGGEEHGRGERVGGVDPTDWSGCE